MSKSIFEHPFYAPLLALGIIPGEDKIPDDLLQAMAILIGRYTDQYIDPSGCRGPAALVILGMTRNDDQALTDHAALMEKP